MDWLSVDEAADRLDVSGRQVRRLAAAGQLAGRRVGSNWVISSLAVRDRARSEPMAGRPLSPRIAWAVLRAASAALGVPSRPDSPSSLDLDHVSDRKDRYRLRALLADAPPVEQWQHWLSRRAEPHRIWVHPGVLDRLRADGRLRPGGAWAVAAAGLGGAPGVADRFYVDEADYERVLVDHRAKPADDGQVVLMVIPDSVPRALLGAPGEPIPAAAGLVDCLSSSDARQRHVAHDNLNRSARHLTSAFGASA